MDVHSSAFPTEARGLPEAQSSEALDLVDGAQIELRITPIVKRLGGATVRMLGYNGSVPGPTLRVRQGSELAVRFVNGGDLEATVHWHGLRLGNRYDGTTATQRPVPVGGTFMYHLKFPDPGVYWYHPHIREDYGQEMGLYGDIVVAPTEPDYWPPVHRELTLMLDDILLEHGKVAAFSRSASTHTAMGRFGNMLLVNGEWAPSFTAMHGEVVRLFLTNTANSRVYNIGLRGARMKLVGGDSGHYEREQFVESVVISPSERAVVDVLFSNTGRLTLEHRTPRRRYSLASFTVVDEPAQPSLAAQFARLRRNGDMAAARDIVAPFLNAEPQKTLALVAEMDLGRPEPTPRGTIMYVCPMHPEVMTDRPGRCPQCSMKLVAKATAPGPTGFVCPMHPEVRSDQPDRCPKCGMKLVPVHLVAEPAAAARPQPPSGDDGVHRHGAPEGEAAQELGGIEWEDDMVEVNRATNPGNTRWKLVDRATGAEGANIAWTFRVGDRVKIRVVNETNSDHPMHHPIHIHGAGRFLILSRDGVVEPNLVWKDTVLVPTGQIVDLLLDITNPGRRMAHCHIAEHHESGMMLSFDVDP